MTTFLYLLAAHFLCDYPLQGDFLARAKNAANPIPGVPFWQALLAHSFMHGMAVFLITGKWYFGVAEFVIHAIVDHGKCKGYLGEGEDAFNIDQFIHIGYKALWALL